MDTCKECGKQAVVNTAGTNWNAQGEFQGEFEQDVCLHETGEFDDDTLENYRENYEEEFASIYDELRGK